MSRTTGNVDATFHRLDAEPDLESDFTIWIGSTELSSWVGFWIFYLDFDNLRGNAHLSAPGLNDAKTSKHQMVIT